MTAKTYLPEVLTEAAVDALKNRLVEALGDTVISAEIIDRAVKGRS